MMVMNIIGDIEDMWSAVRIENHLGVLACVAFVVNELRVPLRPSACHQKQADDYACKDFALHFYLLLSAISEQFLFLTTEVTESTELTLIVIRFSMPVSFNVCR
jgi:hypothetical protein